MIVSWWLLLVLWMLCEKQLYLWWLSTTISSGRCCVVANHVHDDGNISDDEVNDSMLFLSFLLLIMTRCIEMRKERTWSTTVGCIYRRTTNDSDDDEMMRGRIEKDLVGKATSQRFPSSVSPNLCLGEVYPNDRSKSFLNLPHGARTPPKSSSTPKVGLPSCTSSQDSSSINTTVLYWIIKNGRRIRYQKDER